MPERNVLLFVQKYTDYSITLVISGILFWLVNFQGLGGTSDSLLYVEIAKEINSNDFFLVQGFNIKPPALPLLISIIGKDSVLWVNFVCYLIIQAVGVYWARRIKHALLRYLFLSILIFATPHLLIVSFLWTEPLFLLLLLLSIYLLEQFYKTRSLKYIGATICTLVTLPFIRFAGIFLVLPMFGFLALASNNRKTISISLLCFVLLILSWVAIFNEGFEQRWTKFLYPFTSGDLGRVEYNISSYAKALSSWFFPYAMDGFVTRLFSLVLLVFVLFRSSITYFNKKASILFLAPLLFLIYYFAMILVFRVEYYSAERYLAIFYLLFFMNLFYQIDYILSSAVSKKINWIVYAGVILLSSYSIIRALKNVYFWVEVRTESISSFDFGFL